MVKISTTILVLACFLQASTFFGDSKRGWFYYELADNNNTQEKNETKIQKRMNADDLFIASIPLNNLDLYNSRRIYRNLRKS